MFNQKQMNMVVSRLRWAVTESFQGAYHCLYFKCRNSLTPCITATIIWSQTKMPSNIHIRGCKPQPCKPNNILIPYQQHNNYLVTQPSQKKKKNSKFQGTSTKPPKPHIFQKIPPPPKKKKKKKQTKKILKKIKKIKTSPSAPRLHGLRQKLSADRRAGLSVETGRLVGEAVQILSGVAAVLGSSTVFYPFFFFFGGGGFKPSCGFNDVF